MVSFDHRAEGTREESWLTADRWGAVPALVLTDLTRLVVVAAHPDDESLGAGGLMARATALGVPIRVVVATNGDASHPNSPTMTRAALAEKRKAEVRTAVRFVAPLAEIDFLDLPDGELAEHSEQLQAHLDGLDLAPGALLVAPWREDGHGDHDVAGLVSAQVARTSGAQTLEYPVWMWHWAAVDDNAVPWDRFVTLKLGGEEVAAKSRAIEAHRSQIEPLSEAVGDEVLLGEEFQEYFRRPFEVFVTPLGSQTLAEDYFDEFYRGNDDPWGFETRWYEIRKRALTVASLPRPLFASGLEIGCSIGVLTAELAGRCAHLVATDIAEQPLSRARARLIDQAHVRLERLDMPRQWPEGTFDLVVLSEVAYYWSADDLSSAIALIDECLTADGVVVACHWRHPVDGYPERGDDVHAALRAHRGLRLLSSHVEEDFLLDVFVRPGARSVASENGLV
ncbi:MAG: bifunctional PIG-L family deacetylase/class I SAM-dependent methyltransferase [Microbacteriaceae bacterium]|nr:bifunctional PIG-L family deacetylase/class I SAM-dependent methyltransferase [Microbacteriaceae bacterium]